MSIHGNFIQEKTATTVGSVLTLTAIPGNKYARVSDVKNAGELLAYTLRNNNNWQTGLGLVGAGETIDLAGVGAVIYATYENGVYDDTAPAQITLSGDSTLAAANPAQNIDNPIIDGLTVGGVAQTFPGSGLITGNTDVQTLTNKTINDVTNDVHADAVHIQVRNVSGSTIPIGSAVYISGYNVGQDAAEVDLADADDAAAMPAFGITDEEILNNANGHVITTGQIGGLDTSAYSVDDTLYVSTTPGVLTDTRPTGPTELIQAIARVERAHASSGRIHVYGAGRANDVPNRIVLPQVNDPANPTVETGGAGSGTGIYSSNANRVSIATGGSARWQIDTYLIGNAAGSAWLRNIAASATTPTLGSKSDDVDSGLGSAGADQPNVIAGGVEAQRWTESAGVITINMYGDTSFPAATNDAATPTVNWGGDSGFYEISDDLLGVSLAGSLRIYIATNQLYANRTNGWALTWETASAINPVYAINGDANSGMGWVGPDAPCMIAGAVTAQTWTEVAGDITSDLYGDLILPKASGNGIKVDNASPSFGWADLLGDQFSKNTGATKPTLATYNGAVQAWQFADGDEAYITYHIPHDYVLGTDIHLHIHWSQTSASATGGTIDFKYFAIYSKGHNQASGSAFTSTPITATFSSIDINDGGAGLDQYQQHFTEVVISAAAATAALFDRDDFEPDGVIELTLEMDANNLTDSVTVLDPFIHFVDIHYQTTGLIGTKDKAPDFYA